MAALASPLPDVSHIGAPLKNQKHEDFCRNIAKGLSGRQAYIKSGYSEGGADASASKLLKNPKVEARIAQLRLEVAKALHAETVLDRTFRLKCKEQRHLALLQIVNERKADPTVAKVPGGKTGHVILKDMRRIGKNADGSDRVVPFFAVDIPVMQQLDQIERDVAEEIGDLVGKNQGNVAIQIVIGKEFSNV